LIVGCEMDLGRVCIRPWATEAPQTARTALKAPALREVLWCLCGQRTDAETETDPEDDRRSQPGELRPKRTVSAAPDLPPHRFSAHFSEAPPP
jgi:hypothetical protein